MLSLVSRHSPILSHTAPDWTILETANHTWKPFPWDIKSQTQIYGWIEVARLILSLWIQSTVDQLVKHKSLGFQFLLINYNHQTILIPANFPSWLCYAMTSKTIVSYLFPPFLFPTVEEGRVWGRAFVQVHETNYKEDWLTFLVFSL